MQLDVKYPTEPTSLTLTMTPYEARILVDALREYRMTVQFKANTERHISGACQLYTRTLTDLFFLLKKETINHE